MFDFNLNVNDYSQGNSTLTITVQGDLNGGAGGSESIDISIAGTGFGNFGHNSTDAYDVINWRLANTTNTNAYTFSLDFTFDEATALGFLADDILNILVDFHSDVAEYFGWSGGENGSRPGDSPYAQVSYTYNSTEVPEPTSLALFGLGLAGFGFSRKKRKA